jgi:hypothetical protein
MLPILRPILRLILPFILLFCLSFVLVLKRWRSLSQLEVNLVYIDII